MMKSYKRALVCAALMVALCAVSASAGIITHSAAVPPGVVGPDPVASGPGLGFVSVPIVSTPFPNNDDVVGGEPEDNDIVVNLKRFDFNDYIDIEFTVAASQGVTEYRVVEFVDNNTPLPWIGYRMQLGFGVGDDFELAGGAFGLDFDAPFYTPPPSSTAMVPILLSPDELHFRGFHGSGAQVYEVRIDVPDIGVDSFGTFTLRQFPIPVPEPGSLALICLAILGLSHTRRR